MPHRQKKEIRTRTIRHTVSAGGVVLWRSPHGPRILLTRHKKMPKWQLPKGHVEPGESIDEAALREVYEETGLGKAHIIRKLAVVKRKYVNRLGELKTVHYFLMEPLEKITERPRDRKHVAIKWVPPHQAFRQLLLPEQQGLLRRFKTILR